MNQEKSNFTLANVDEINLSNMKKFISWRRVSTKKQGSSGLGLEAQTEIINYFVKSEGGILMHDYQEVYTGKDLEGCTELQKAMKHCKAIGATLIIAKTDRFRNTIEALQIYDEMQGQIYFCDLPHTDKFTLTLFFALAEREAKIISIRTKQALAAKKARGERVGREKGCDTSAAVAAQARNKRERAKNRPDTTRIWLIVKDCHTGEEWNTAVEMLNAMQIKTPSGLEFNLMRARACKKNFERYFI